MPEREWRVPVSSPFAHSSTASAISCRRKRWRDLIAAATPLQARVAFDQLEGTLTRRIAAIDARLFDLIARLEASLDFPDEGYHFIEPQRDRCRSSVVIEQLDALLADAARGRMIREGVSVVIAGGRTSASRVCSTRSPGTSGRS